MGHPRFRNRFHEGDEGWAIRHDVAVMGGRGPTSRKARDVGHPVLADFAGRANLAEHDSIAVGELCGGDSRAPVEAGCQHVVLRRVPEGTAVHAVVSVDTHGAVIAPSVRGVHLRASTGDYLYLGLQIP